MKPPKPKPADPEPTPPTTRRRPGRPAYVPTDKDRQTVVRMVAAGIDQALIGRCVGLIDEKTKRCLGLTEKPLRRHFRDELDTTYAKIKSQVAAVLIGAAQDGDVKAAMFYLEKHGWVQSDRLTVFDGGTEADPATLTDEQIAERLSKLKRTGAVVRASKTQGTVH